MPEIENNWKHVTIKGFTVFNKEEDKDDYIIINDTTFEVELASKDWSQVDSKFKELVSGN